MLATDEEVIQRIKKIASPHDKAVGLHEPCFMGNEWKYVKECLDTGWVSSVGKFVDKFENDLTDVTGAKFAIATANGTSALHISYLLAGVTTGDEVLVPTLTFVATINAIAYCGAIPHFIDSEEQSLGIDVVRLEDYLNNIARMDGAICVNKLTGRPIRALCVMHTLGHPVDLDPIEQLCKKYQLALIEDAAEALGSYYKGAHVGHRGLLGALSFNGNKIITTGGGGAILTNSTELAKRAKHITTTAKLSHAWLFEHDQVGYNYRLPNINAALGCAQLEQLPQFLRAKRTLSDQYSKNFLKCAGLRFITEPSYAKSNYWLNAILLDESVAEIRNSLLDSLNKAGIAVRPLWNLQHSQLMYKECPRMDLSMAESLQKRLIKLPSSPHLATNNLT
ncbi:MAG: aminotransferase DegT [Gammaproteobacteria bacterium RIFCSPHIGHO2_12_FULL_37_14]|nr:MAG: aminotransferase DegT [Gammaproteobacteria bacterium RIFCSPHIGHO2_12_FULL_37_14]